MKKKASHSVFRGKWLAGLCAAAVLSAAGWDLAQTRTDFSGLWKLSLGKSNFAGEGAPSSKTQRVEQKGNSLDVVIDEVRGENPIHGTSHYTLDGQECVNDVLGNPLKSAVTWEGAVMVMRTWGRFGDADILLLDRWSLSAGGKTLTIARHFEGHGQTIDQTLVFGKQ